MPLGFGQEFLDFQPQGVWNSPAIVFLYESHPQSLHDPTLLGKPIGIGSKRWGKVAVAFFPIALCFLLRFYTGDKYGFLIVFAMGIMAWLHVFWFEQEKKKGGRKEK